MNDNDPRRDKLIDEISNIEIDMADEYSRLVAAFKPYLRLGNI